MKKLTKLKQIFNLVKKSLSIKDLYICNILLTLHKDGPISWFNVKDAYTGDLNSIRGKLVDQFGISWEALQQRILLDPDVNFLYRGMIRFMEEELAIKSFPSKNQLHVAAKRLTREMMLINEAYSKLVSTEFSNNIRLSMHPSVNNGAKYSFQLIPGKNVHHSAWHCALFVDGDEYETIHRKDAELRGYQLIFQNKQPYYYTR